MPEPTTFLSHLKELKRRILICALTTLVTSIIGYIFHTTIIEFLSQPIAILSKITHSETMFYVTTVFEGFMVRIKFALLTGCVLSSPIYLYHILSFILPGLHKKERRLIQYSLLASSILAIFGFYLCYFKLIPYSIQFLMSLDYIPKNVGILLQYNQSISFVFEFILWTMVIFQFPIILEILLYLNILSRHTLMKYSRFVIVSIVITAGAITPGPDITSQIGVAIPMIAFYYLTILIAKLFKFGEG